MWHWIKQAPCSLTWHTRWVEGDAYRVVSRKISEQQQLNFSYFYRKHLLSPTVFFFLPRGWNNINILYHLFARSWISFETFDLINWTTVWTPNRWARVNNCLSLCLSVTDYPVCRYSWHWFNTLSAVLDVKSVLRY